MDSTSTCSNCRFWKPREEPGTGKCKWGPPIYLPTGNGGSSRAAWPTTPGNEFCFRWESYTPSKLELTNDQRQANIEHEKEIKSMKRDGVKSVEPAPVDELKPAPTPAPTPVPSGVVEPEMPATPNPVVEAQALNTPKLFDNQIAQLVRGKRRPGERIE